MNYVGINFFNQKRYEKYHSAMMKRNIIFHNNHTVEDVDIDGIKKYGDYFVFVEDIGLKYLIMHTIMIFRHKEGRGNLFMKETYINRNVFELINGIEIVRNDFADKISRRRCNCIY